MEFLSDNATRTVMSYVTRARVCSPKCIAFVLVPLYRTTPLIKVSPLGSDYLLFLQLVLQLWFRFSTLPMNSTEMR